MKCAAVEEVNNLMLPVAAAKQIAVGENLQFNISGGICAKCIAREINYNFILPVAIRLGGTHVHIPNTIGKT